VTARTEQRRGRLYVMAAVALVTLFGVVAGCTLAGVDFHQAVRDRVGVQSTADPASPAQPLAESKPVTIDIPRIGAESSLVELGLKPDKTLEVPPVSQPMQAGWYAKGPTPGEVGPAVIAGHVDGGGQKGIFYRLHDLERGDVIAVQREDGGVARFAVDRVVQVSKKDFPAREVYGATPDAQLRLITCGGEFDSRAHSYTDNIIVFAKLVN
jgi:LPXTG-site transpeptidase (sortase) family protein